MLAVELYNKTREFLVESDIRHSGLRFISCVKINAYQSSFVTSPKTTAFYGNNSTGAVVQSIKCGILCQIEKENFGQSLTEMFCVFAKREPKNRWPHHCECDDRTVIATTMLSIVFPMGSFKRSADYFEILIPN